MRARHPESRIALARAAIDAALWGLARTQLAALAPATGHPPEARVCRLMAALEEGEGREPGAAQSWLLRLGEARRDPAWRCAACGHRAEAWAPHCPSCEAFDTLRWGAPRAEAVPTVASPEGPKLALSLGAEDKPAAAIDESKRCGLA